MKIIYILGYASLHFNYKKKKKEEISFRHYLHYNKYF